MSRYIGIWFIVLTLLLAACSGAVQTAAPNTPAEDPMTPATETPVVPTEAPTATEYAETPTPTAGETSQGPALSFEAITFRDETTGFEFEYPAAWTTSGMGVLGSRGSGAQFTLDGAPMLDVTVYQWDPKGDLKAYAGQRRTAWEASGFSIVSEEEVSLQDGQRGLRYVVQTTEGEQAFFFFTTVGERYLQLSGTQDLALLSEISGTVRALAYEVGNDVVEGLDCASRETGSFPAAACRVADGILARDFTTMPGIMTNPFVIGYWGSEGISASPSEILAELADYRLPSDPSSPISFTVDRGVFPTLQGQSPETLLGPLGQAVGVVYSEGWGPDGQGAALLFFSEGESGYVWYGMVYAQMGFDM